MPLDDRVESSRRARIPRHLAPGGQRDEGQTSMPYGQSANGRLHELTGLGDTAISWSAPVAGDSHHNSGVPRGTVTIMRASGTVTITLPERQI